MAERQAAPDQTGAYTRIVLGVDPGTAITGYGVVGEHADGAFELLACGVLRTDADRPMHLRLKEIFQDLQAILHEFRPDEMAVEKLFFGRNVTTAISVGQARGAILLAAALNGVDVVEYTPAEVKEAIAGYGNADKQQVQEMVRRTLHLAAAPAPDDAADAVAVAVCHLQRALYRSLVEGG
jgi:crossover junction endodeoxyribonuclease RuvC